MRPSDRQPESGASRLNLLLTYGGWREESVVDQLSRLLQPMGVNSIRVDTGEEAADVIESTPIHAALVDLDIPLRRGEGAPPAGSRTLRLLQALVKPPPTVVVRPPQPQSRESVRGLLEALHHGAFAVLDRPLRLEITLEVLRRILHRYYEGTWPR